MPDDNAHGRSATHNADHAAIRAYLKARGHAAGAVDREITAAAAQTRGGLVAALCRLHRTAVEDFEMARAS